MPPCRDGAQSHARGQDVARVDIATSRFVQTFRVSYLRCSPCIPYSWSQCDEQKPVCGACSRRGLKCDFTTKFIFRDTSDVVRRFSRRADVPRGGDIAEDSSIETTAGAGEPFQQSTNDATVVAAARPLDMLPVDRGNDENAGPMADDSGAVVPVQRDCPVSVGYESTADHFPIPMDQDTTVAANNAESQHVALDDLTVGSPSASTHGGASGNGHPVLQPVRDTSISSSTPAAESDGHAPFTVESGVWGDSAISANALCASSDYQFILLNHEGVRRFLSGDHHFMSDLCHPAKEDIIMSHWRIHLLPRMAPILSHPSHLDLLIKKHEIVKYAVLALSASHVNQFDAFGAILSVESRQTNPDMYATGLVYYSQALEMLRAEEHNHSSKLDPCAKLAAIIFCTYFEIGSGTFSGSLCHLKKIDDIVLSAHDRIVDSPMGIELMIAWATLRAQHLMDFFPFRSSKFISFFDIYPFRGELDRYIRTSSSATALLTIRLSVASRTSDLALLMLTIGHDSTSPIFRKWSSLMSQIGRRNIKEQLSPQKSLSDLYQILEAERRLLDDWEASIPMTEKPTEGFSSTDLESNRRKLVGFQIRPLRFFSHRAAMNYLRYCCAQMFASQHNIQQCVAGGSYIAQSFGGTTSCQVDPWVLLILRIVSGLDILSCLIENIYEIGALWILMHTALRCNSLDVLKWIADYFSQMEASGGAREGRLPIRLLKRMIDGIITEWHKGRTVHLIYNELEEYREIQELCEIGSNGSPLRAVVHGRIRDADGSAESEAMPFIDILQLS